MDTKPRSVWIHGMFWLPALGIIESWQQHADTTTPPGVPVCSAHHALLQWKCEQSVVCSAPLSHIWWAVCVPTPGLTSDAPECESKYASTARRVMWADQGPMGAGAGCLGPPPHWGRRLQRERAGQWQSVADTGQCIIIIIRDITRWLLMFYLTFKSVKHEYFMNPSNVNWCPSISS